RRAFPPLPGGGEGDGAVPDTVRSSQTRRKISPSAQAGEASRMSSENTPIPPPPPPAYELTLIEETPPSVLPGGGVVYKLNSSRASFGELWRDSRSPLVFIRWITKLMQVRLPGSVNDPNVESLRPFEVTAAALPKDAAARIDLMLRELGTVGFETSDPIF